MSLVRALVGAITSVVLCACSESHLQPLDLGPGPPAVAVDPLELDFGNVRPGEEVSRSFSVTNVGGEPLRVSNLAVVGHPGFSLRSDHLDFALAPGTAEYFRRVKEHGLRDAFKRRDAEFGDGRARVDEPETRS